MTSTLRIENGTLVNAWLIRVLCCVCVLCWSVLLFNLSVVWFAGQEVDSCQGNKVSTFLLHGVVPFHYFHIPSPCPTPLPPHSLINLPPCPTPRDFSWCPTENNLAYWVPEINEIPAKVTVLAIPSRMELNTKSRMLVNEVWRSRLFCVLFTVYSVQWWNVKLTKDHYETRPPLKCFFKGRLSRVFVMMLFNGKCYLSYPLPFFHPPPPPIPPPFSSSSLLPFLHSPIPPSLLFPPPPPPLLTVQAALAQGRWLPVCESGPLPH